MRADSPPSAGRLIVEAGNALPIIFLTGHGGGAWATRRFTEPANKIGRHRLQSIILTISPAVVDCDVFSLHETGFNSSLAESGDVMRNLRFDPALSSR